MTELYLIAHKVRGEPAFDVASRAVCVHCQGYESVTGDWCEPSRPQAECAECDGEGFTWIIPTSGHRAYPYMTWPIDRLVHYNPDDNWQPTILDELGPITESEAFATWPDHYPTRASPEAPKPTASALLTALGLARPKVTIQRRV